MVSPYLIVMMPLSGLYFVIMVVILFAYQRAKSKYIQMIDEGYYFVWNKGSYLGISPETAETMGLTGRPERESF